MWTCQVCNRKNYGTDNVYCGQCGSSKDTVAPGSKSVYHCPSCDTDTVISNEPYLCRKCDRLFGKTALPMACDLLEYEWAADGMSFDTLLAEEQQRRMEAKQC